MDYQISQAKLLVARLERLSADSYWAHQASGLRGALLRSIESCESWQAIKSPQESQQDPASQLDNLMKVSFEILVRGAQEMHR
jgi:hypothetical protein